MAKPCKVTIKKPGSAAKEMTFEDYMDMLYNGGLEQFIKDGTINIDGLKGDSPFAEGTTKPKGKKAKQNELDAFMREGLGGAVGGLKQRGYNVRAEEQLGAEVSEYETTSMEALNEIVEAKFQELLARYEAGEKDIFERLVSALKDTPFGDIMENNQLVQAYISMFTKAQKHFFITGETGKWNKILDSIQKSGTVGGKILSSLAEASTPEQLMNRIMQEDTSRENYLNQVLSGRMTLREAISQLRDIAKITDAQANAIVTKAMSKIKKTATVVTTSPTFKEQRTASVKAIKDILSQKTAPGPIALSNSIIAQITPHIIDFVRSYIQEGVFSAKVIKNRVWNQLKDSLPGERAALDQIVDDNMSTFDAEIKRNKDASVVNRLAKAFEGVIDVTGVKQKALKMLSDTILENDPAYVLAKSRGEKTKAKDRLKTVLNNKAKVESMVMRARDIAKTSVDVNTKIDAATKMAIKNEIDSLVSDLLGLPIGDVEKRAAAASMSKEDLAKEINRIATQHFTNPGSEIRTLAETLVNNLGIDPAYANQLQAEIEPMVAEMVSDKLKSNKAKIDTIMQGLKDAESMKKGVIKAISKGQVADAVFEEELLKALGYKGMSVTDIAKLQNYYNRLQMLQPGEELYQQVNRYINDILNEYDETTAALVARWFSEQMYINALSDPFKTAIMASGVGAVVSAVQHGAFTALYNPARMIRAMKYAQRMKKQGATMGWETVAAKWQRPESRFGETTLLEKPEEKAHGAVVRVTRKEYEQIFNDIINAKGGRKAYFVAQALFKSLSHAMGAGYRTRKFMPAYSEISMVMMSIQDILMGGMLQDMYTYIQAETYVDILNEKSGVPMKKGSALFNQQKNQMLNEILQTDPQKINDLNAEVAREAQDRINNGESLPKGWAKRRLREKIHRAMPNEVIDEMAHQAKKALFLQKPESRFGALAYNFLTSRQAIKDKDNWATASARMALNAVFAFMRLNVVSAEYAYKSLPILPAVTKIAYGKNIRYQGNKQIEVDMTTEDKVKRLMQNAVVTMAWVGLLASMFDWDEDEEGNSIITLNPNSPIKFYGSADDSKQKTEMEAEGAEPNSVTFFGYNIPLTLLGFGAGSIGKILGEVSNDVRFAKDDRKHITLNRTVGLVAAQISGSDYSPVKRAAKKLFTLGEAKYLEAGEILLLDGLETALSPTELENLKKDYEAFNGIQAERRSGVIDNIVSDIFFTDVFMDTNGGKVYDHFGQPVYVKPSNPILKALVPENVWKDGTSHVENSPYYNLTNEKWFPKVYSRFDAAEWETTPDDQVYRISEDFEPSLRLLIDKQTAMYIDENKSEIDELTGEEKLEKIKEQREDAIAEIKTRFSDEMYNVYGGQETQGATEQDKYKFVYKKREEVIEKLRKEYGIETK